MQLAIKKLNGARFLWRVMSDLIGYREIRNEIPLPIKIGNFDLIRPILEDKKDNKFQYGIYKDSAGKEYIAKQLSLKDPGIDEYKLRNEINVYSILSNLYKEKGDLIDRAYPDIKIPKLALILDDKTRLLFLAEKVPGETLFELSLEESIKHIERALNYFKFLNTIRDFKDEALTKRSFISMSVIMILATLGALAKHPGEYTRIFKGFFIIIGSLPFLLRNKERALIHRDIGYLNILTNPDGSDYIIDFEASSYMHPMWEIAQIAVGCRRREGFLEAFNKTETMQKILKNRDSLRLYKLLSIYCGIHILSTSGRSEERVISDKKYMRYVLEIRGSYSDKTVVANQTHLFSHIFLVLKIGILSLFKQINTDTSLPAKYGEFELRTTLKDFPCGIGIYEDNQSHRVLIKVWRGSVKTYAYYQFLKEVRLYGLLHSVLKRIGSNLEEKYRAVHIPHILEKEISPNHIMAVFEYIDDCIHLGEVKSISEKARIYDLATDFWRYIGSQLNEAERAQLPKRTLANTLFAYLVAFAYALIRYPKKIPALIKTVPIVLRAVPAMASNWREGLVHRDFHFENVLVSKGRVIIIDFGDNALTNSLNIFVNSLHWEWDNNESREIILKSVASLCGKSQETADVFRALFVISAVQLLHDAEDKERLKLNFRCFNAVVNKWDEISAILSGDTLNIKK